MTGISVGLLESFFQHSVRNLEGPVTYCLDLSGAGASASGTIRIEYEDDFGIRAFQTQSDNVFNADIKYTGTTKSVNVIWMDDFGFTQVIGSGVSGSSFNAKVRFYNFPSYEEALNQSIVDAQNKCKNGTYTVAQCLGYNFPSTFWWNMPVAPVSERQRMIDQANAILNDSSKTSTLGTVVID
jgi:hypothetical protein